MRGQRGTKPGKGKRSPAGNPKEREPHTPKTNSARNVHCVYIPPLAPWPVVCHTTEARLLRKTAPFTGSQKNTRAMNNHEPP